MFFRVFRCKSGDIFSGLEIDFVCVLCFVLSVATKKEIILDYSLFTFYIFGMVSDFSFIEGKGSFFWFVLVLGL